MPCAGCYGPTSRVRDFGAKALIALASTAAGREDAEIDRALAGIPDPAGLFYRLREAVRHPGWQAGAPHPGQPLGVGVVEAPRGTLIHHYETDERGLIRKANLIVATQNNAARVATSVEKAAKVLAKGGGVSEGVLNVVETALRAYDPSMGCATHALPGRMPLLVRVLDRHGAVRTTLRRDTDGQVQKDSAR